MVLPSMNSKANKITMPASQGVSRNAKLHPPLRVRVTPVVADDDAEVRGLLRRSAAERASYVLVSGDIVLDRRMRKVARGDREISMAASEYRLLEVFLEKQRQVLSRSYLLDHVWGQDAGVDERTVDVYVGRLRKSLIRKNGFDPIRGSFLMPLHCRLSSNQHHFIDDFVNDGSSLDLDFVIHAEDAPGISLRGKPFRFVRHEACEFELDWLAV